MLINKLIDVEERFNCAIIPSMISSHGARRSFATINTLRNIPRNSILRATGHASEESFVRYICYNDE